MTKEYAATIEGNAIKGETMEKLDVLIIPAGEIIHFHGMPVQLTDNCRVLGKRENFMTDSTGLFLHSAVEDKSNIK